MKKIDFEQIISLSFHLIKSKKYTQPETVFLFKPGDLVRQKAKGPISKIDPPAYGPYRVIAILGHYCQQVTIMPQDGKPGRTRVVHASKLALYFG